MMLYLRFFDACEVGSCLLPEKSIVNKINKYLSINLQKYLTILQLPQSIFTSTSLIIIQFVMIDHLRTLVYSDKIFDSPILGKVSCGAFSDTLAECKKINFRSQTTDPCLELKHLTSKCYSSKNNQQINKWIAQQFHQSLLMFKFLKDRKSTLPEKMSRNSWAVFTNSSNLEIYEKLISKDK